MIKNYIKKYEKYSLVISILMLFLSIFLIWKPLKSLEIFVIAFGIILILNGIGNFISYFTIGKEERLYSFDLLSGFIMIISGIMVLCFHINLISLLPQILGIWMIVNNLFKLQIAINLSTVPNSGWIWLILISILTVILGILLIFHPFGSMITLAFLAGIFLFISELINIIESIYLLVKLKE